VGGVCVQAEDEIASINMVLGAAYAGKKAMTATSGPGFSLMVEGLGLGTMAELPCVVVDAQRAGPSTGMPTRHEQGDLYLAAFGGHGEVPRLVLAPTSVEDCFYQAVNAFNLAEKYQVPVILLSDTVLAVRTESIPRPDLNRITVINRRLFEPNGHADGYLRYAPTDDGVSPMSLPGQPGGAYVATGLEHNETGRPRYDPATHRRMTEKRFRKIERAAADAPPADRYGDPTAEIGIVTWGSTAGVVVEAIDRARERGIRAEMVAPKLLRPLPDHQLADFMRSKRVILVPEVNYSGQFADLLTARYKREVIPVRVYAGQPFKVAEILQALEEVAQHVG
jgi:2-oxoglutarate ferredoxin oxidoreductase subunit alpha